MFMSWSIIQVIYVYVMHLYLGKAWPASATYSILFHTLTLYRSIDNSLNLQMEENDSMSSWEWPNYCIIRPVETVFVSHPTLPSESKRQLDTTLVEESSLMAINLIANLTKSTMRWARRGALKHTIPGNLLITILWSSLAPRKQPWKQPQFHTLDNNMLHHMVFQMPVPLKDPIISCISVKPLSLPQLSPISFWNLNISFLVVTSLIQLFIEATGWWTVH